MGQRLPACRQTAHGIRERWRIGPITEMVPLLVLILIFSLLGSALPGFAAVRESRPRSALASVSELEQRVTYCETKIPLGELVAKVAADTGVSLAAARDVADEPVAVVVTDFPARELLEQVADLLDYRWSRRTTGAQVFRSSGVQADAGRPSVSQRPMPQTPEHLVRYEIWQDLASKQREEALRQSLYTRAEQDLQERLSISRELAGKSQEEMRRLWDEATRWNERLEKLPPEERRVLVNSAEGRRQSLRHTLARYLWSPVNRSLAGWMTRLPPEQWAALRSGRQLVFSSHPQPGKLPLPPEVLRVFRTSRPSISPPGEPLSARPEREAQERRREREQQERWDQAEHYDVIFRLLAFDTLWWGAGEIQLAAVTQPFRGGQRLGGQQDNPDFTLYVGSGRALPPSEEDPSRRARLEQDPVLSVKKVFRPDTRPYVDPLFPNLSRTVRLLPEVLPELARVYGVHFIADSYWRGGWEAPTISPLAAGTGPRPLFEVLDRVARAWDCRGKLIRIRDRTWFLDRPREIPLRLVRRWAAVTDQMGALPLEELVSAATALTDLQADTLEGLLLREIFPPQLNDLRSLSGSLGILRLYGRLSPAQRQALQAGQPVTVAQLSPTLRPLVEMQLYRANRWRIPMPDFANWAMGHVTLTRTLDVRIREQRGRSVAWRLESDPAPHGVMPPDAVTRFPVTRLRMEIHYGEQAPAAVGLIFAADPARPD